MRSPVSTLELIDTLDDRGAYGLDNRGGDSIARGLTENPDAFQYSMLGFRPTSYSESEVADQRNYASHPGSQVKIV